MYPVLQQDGNISSPVLFKNFQSSWEQRQENNKVKVKNDFMTEIKGDLVNYYSNQAKIQYLDNSSEKVSDANVYIYKDDESVTLLNKSQQLQE